MLGASAFCNFVVICSCRGFLVLSIYSIGYSKSDASAMDWNSESLESGSIVLSSRVPSHNDN